ncbi:MAG: exopolysaccharide biosynthesis protein [Alphaproteobacteria bacterium]
MNDCFEGALSEPERLVVPPPTTELTSALIRRVVGQLTGDDVSIGYLVIQFRRRSFGGLFLVLSALGLLPGISIIAGLAMIFPAIQLAIGLRAPLLPRFMRRRRVSIDIIRAVASRTVPWVERIERYTRPRYFLFSQAPVLMAAGVMCVGLALVIILPLPFSNFPPAISFLVLSVGMIQRDGLFIILGMFLSAIALLIGAAITFLAINAASLLISNAG